MPPLRSRPLLLLLCTLAPLSLATRCEVPGLRSVDLGSGLRLWLWVEDEQAVSADAREVTLGARLVGPLGRDGEVIVLAASIDPALAVLDADLRFGPHRAGRPEGHGQGRGRHAPLHAPNRDTLRVRLPAGLPLDLSALAFTALDRFGGILDVATAATGRFRVEEIDGRTWFVTPEGHGFFSAGVNNITFGGDYSPPLGYSPYRLNAEALYGDEEGWARVAEERLRSFGFNTLGAWSSSEYMEPSLPHTPVLSFNRAAPEVPGWPTGQTGYHLRDYFAPEFDEGLAAYVEQARPCAENPFCIGVFTDNELPWGESVLQIGTYVDAYLTLPPGAPGKLALQAFFEERYGNVEAFDAAWSLDLASFDDIQQLDAVEGDASFCNVDGRRADRQAFVARVAARYYERVHAALRGAFPDLLILGTRFLGVYTAPAVVAAAAPFVDVVSVNDYDWDENGRGLFRSEGGPLGYLFLDDPVTDLGTLHEISGKPVMVTEWTFRTPTPDVPVLFPPFLPTVGSQTERADRYEAFMLELLARPYVIGSHWFKYHDQPATGRGDGENSRFGIVNIEDTPYAELTERMTAVNASIARRRLAGPSASAAAAARAAEAEAPLGERVFSIAPPQEERSGFFVHILPGVNLATAVAGGPLRLVAGAPDAAGVAPLALAEDVLLAFETVVGDVACLRLHAAGSSGELACSGGFGHDVVVQQAAGTGAPPPDVTAFLGADSGPGAATLFADLEFTQLAAGATPDDCLTASYPPPLRTALSTAVVTSAKGGASFETRGENFVCGPDGVTWRREDGPGMLVVGVPTRDSRVPGGDLATSFRVADSEEACRP